LIDLLAAVVLYMAATYCVALGLTCLVAPARATRFLMGFVRSAAAHYSEIALRLLVGWAFLRDAHLTAFPAVFVGFGSVLVVTSCILLVVPWQWHRRFAQHTIPRALQHLRLIGIASFAGGIALAITMLYRVG
jgi:uncharacterized protein YjeT (DUF2065 family)